MSSNEQTDVARHFHEATTHTPYSIRASTHTLDWDVKPFPFKIYSELPALALPRTIDPLAVDTFAALDPARAAPRQSLTTAGLAALLYYSAGVTKKRTYPGGEILFRAAASTGALYQTEVYVAAGRVDDLPAGLYHFCPGDFSLRCVRAGDVRGVLAEAAADDDIARATASVVLTAIYWRNTWKYQARGFRHLFWDSGTMLANLLAAAHSLGQAPHLLAGFVDQEVNRLLGLDADREGALEVVLLGREATPPAPDLALGDVRHDVVPLSEREVDYPALREMYAASSLTSATDVRRWRAVITRRRSATEPTPAAARVPLPPVRDRVGRTLGETVERRGSTRRFSHAPLSAEELSSTLFWATREFDADFSPGLVELFLILTAVQGIAPGAYRYDPLRHDLEIVKTGSFRRESGYLCLEQALGADAAAVIYFLAPLAELLRAAGNRGYRLANLEAGLIGGRAYLAAYAQGFGASGLTFYDRAVVEFFAPLSAGREAIFVTALGRSVSYQGEP